MPTRKRTLTKATVIRVKTNANTFANTLSGILKQPGKKALDDIVLRGGSLRVKGALAGDPWMKTVWRRSGPIRPVDHLIDPIESLVRDTRTLASKIQKLNKR